MKKLPGYIIILHMCTINNNCMMYDSWDMEHDRIFRHFLPFYPCKKPEKSKFWKNEKRPGDIIILHVYHKWQLYDVWFLRYWVQQIFLSFWPINDNHMMYDSWDIIVCIGVSSPPQKHPPSFLPSPPPKSANCPSPSF